jgi:hypothetical protein
MMLKSLFLMAANNVLRLVNPFQLMKKKLTDASIEVKSSKCAVLTGTHFPAVCGGKTGRIHVFTISEQSLTEAESLGFTSVSSLRESMGYSETACK